MIKDLLEIAQWNLAILAGAIAGFFLLPLAFVYVVVSRYDRNDVIKG
jgi:hypothetical protein